jgi:hypothetical protein
VGYSIVPAPLSLIAVGPFARAITQKLASAALRLTIDEIEPGKNAGEWIVTVSFWLSAPPVKGGAALISSALPLREKRILRIEGPSPARLISMKVK